MPEGEYHKIIKDTIYTVARESKKHKKVQKEKIISLTHPTEHMLPIQYLPEIHIITNHGKKYVFEILDSQGKEPNLIIADIIQAYLVENVSKVFFITKNTTEYELVYRLSKIIGGRMEENGYPRKELPDVTIYEIKKEDLNPKTLYSIFKEYAKKDNW